MTISHCLSHNVPASRPQGNIFHFPLKSTMAPRRDVRWSERGRNSVDSSRLHHRRRHQQQQQRHQESHWSKPMDGGNQRIWSLTIWGQEKVQVCPDILVYTETWEFKIQLAAFEHHWSDLIQSEQRQQKQMSCVSLVAFAVLRYL